MKSPFLTLLKPRFALHKHSIKDLSETDYVIFNKFSGNDDLIVVGHHNATIFFTMTFPVAQGNNKGCTIPRAN